MGNLQKRKPPTLPDGARGISADDEQRMTSLEIAEITGKPHNDLMKAIRKMEPAWVKVNGGNFSLVEYQDKKGELRPCFSLTKNECIYIATKFNDEARAKLVLRWNQLEKWHDEFLRQRLELMTQKAKCLTAEKMELANEKMELEHRLAVEKPLADYCKDTLQSQSDFTVTAIAHQLQMTPVELNKFLCLRRIQYGRSGCYVPYADYARRGFTKTRTYNHRNYDGTISTTHRTTWTEEGIRFIIDLVEEERKLLTPTAGVVQLELTFECNQRV